MKRRQGIQFHDPQWTVKVKRVMDAFVDDTTAWVNTFLQNITNTEQEYITEILHELQSTAQDWEELLNATSGALKLSKCFYYLIHWRFDKNGTAKTSTHP